VLDLVFFGLALVLVGFGIVALALLGSGKDERSEVKGAGVIMVGPIPIVFGSDYKWASVAIGLAIALVLLGILFYVL
jgi:uncharacterized protein (TIGR00304 family)